MADITMCQQQDCADFKHCYRAQAKPNPWRQSYFASDPRSMDGTCSEFIEYSEKS